MSAFGARRKPLRAGDRLDGRYELLFQYAQGGMATVWLARVQGKHGFEKLYAVKTILPHLAADEAFRNMFLDEARIASRIRHTNVAEIEDLGEDNGHLYMVLEWIQGDALSKLTAAILEVRDPIPADLMLRIAADACAGLHAAHELADDYGQLLNVVHRDVSPQNIMISEAGVVKVIDFGVAKAVGRASEETRTGLIKGKLEYLAPELALAGEVDRRADVWAIGATLYEMFAGRPPFTGKSDLDVLRAISIGKPPDALPSSVPAPVADVVMRALQPALSKRIPSALDLQRQLESAMAFPIGRDEIGHAMGHYLKARMTERHQSIGDALREAAARAPAPTLGRPGTPLQLSPMRASFPSLPPEASPVRSQSVVLRPAQKAEFGEGDAKTIAAESVGDLSQPNEAPPQIRPLHMIWMTVATLVTVGVWSTVVALALESRDDGDGPRTTESEPHSSSSRTTSGSGGSRAQH